MKVRRPSNQGYFVSGLVYIAASLPAWGLLATGRLLEMRNAYLLVSLAGTPLGLLFLAFARGMIPQNSRSDNAVRMGYMGMGLLGTLVGSLILVKLGVEQMQTAALFSAMATTYLALLTFGFLISAALARRS